MARVPWQLATCPGARFTKNLRALTCLLTPLLRTASILDISLIFFSPKIIFFSQKIIFHQKKIIILLVKNYFLGFFFIFGEKKITTKKAQ